MLPWHDAASTSSACLAEAESVAVRGQLQGRHSPCFAGFAAAEIIAMFERQESASISSARLADAESFAAAAWKPSRSHSPSLAGGAGADLTNAVLIAMSPWQDLRCMSCREGTGGGHDDLAAIRITP